MNLGLPLRRASAVRWLVPCCLVAAASAGLNPGVRATEFVVTNSADSGPGTLREAILGANEAGNLAMHLIRFDIPGDVIHVIRPLSPLPPLAVPMIVDAYTQRGARPNSASNADNAVLRIHIDGHPVPPANDTGFPLQGGRALVRGFAITRTANPG